MANHKDVADEAKELIKSRTLNLGTKHLCDLGPRQKHFVFTMRYHYLNYVELGKPFYCSEKQLKYLKDLLEKAGVK